MFEKFYPKEYVDSTYIIDFDSLFRQGYRGIIFDVDNTLVKHNEPANEKAKHFFEKLNKIGFKTLLLSNNKEPRVKKFAQAVNAQYIYKAGKPGTGGYLRAMKMMGSKKNTTLLVGDQLFTDVWGANRAGIYSILVKPVHPKEEIQIILKRFLERIVLFFYKRKKRKHG